MKTITHPTVYLIGSQMYSKTQLEAFLADHNTEWNRSEDGKAHCVQDELAEMAGRLCYMSFTSPRPGGNKAYLENILSSGHGCYDDETEVLTSRGWRKWNVVDQDTLYATRNSNGQVEYHRAINLITIPYEGKMYRVEAKGVDLLVTPNHRMYVCGTSTVEGRLREKFDFIKAEELESSAHCYVKSGEWINGNPFENAIAALLGFAIGDGYVSGNQIKFHLRKERKIAWLKAACDRANMRLTERGDHYTLDADKFSELFNSIYDHNREKVIPQQVLCQWNKSSLLSLYDGLMQSDGHKGKTGDSFDTTSDTLAGQMQQLCLHIGLAANICYVYGPKERTTSFGDKPLTRLSIIRRELKPEVNKYVDGVGKTSWVENWKGTVYCAEVPNNTLYVRRNGKPVWCGNSVLEHAVWNFILTGISRTLSHELVRHRQGVGYSQLSQRYVDESVAEYVEPDIVASDPELHKDWVLAVATAHDAYLSLVDKIKQKLDYDPTFRSKWTTHTNQGQTVNKTEMRKLARQAARSVLPNATETKIFFTANARALRHILEQRGSRFAEPEIRKLANELHRQLVEHSPHIFSDYVKTPLPDGTWELTTAYRKV